MKKIRKPLGDIISVAVGTVGVVSLGSFSTLFWGLFFHLLGHAISVCFLIWRFKKLRKVEQKESLRPIIQTGQYQFL
jgi:hypothetical protein